jgi:hypothetical protein
VRLGERRVELDGSVEVTQAFLEARFGPPHPRGRTPQVGLVCCDVVGREGREPSPLFGRELDLEGRRDLLGDLGLHGEELVYRPRPVELRSPKVRVTATVHQLRGNADVVARTAGAPFQDDVEARDPREVRDDLCVDAVGEERVGGIGADVFVDFSRCSRLAIATIALAPGGTGSAPESGPTAQGVRGSLP